MIVVAKHAILGLGSRLPAEFAALKGLLYSLTFFNISY